MLFRQHRACNGVAARTVAFRRRAVRPVNEAAQSAPTYFVQCERSPHARVDRPRELVLGRCSPVDSPLDHSLCTARRKTKENIMLSPFSSCESL